MLWAQPSVLQTVLEVSLPTLGVSDLALEHVYNGLIGGIADGAHVGGGIQYVLKTELLALSFVVNRGLEIQYGKEQHNLSSKKYSNLIFPDLHMNSKKIISIIYEYLLVNFLFTTGRDDTL